MAEEEGDVSRREQTSRLLADWANGDRAARDRLMPLVYDELRRLAHHYMKGEREGHVLQTTGLVNEVYLRVAGLDRMQWRDRAHFLAMAATLMRRILVDDARERARDKRGAGLSFAPLDEQADAVPSRGVDLIALDEALAGLALLDARQGQIVELRFFGGLSVEETAEALEISPATVKREWSSAKAWLHHQLAAK